MSLAYHEHLLEQHPQPTYKRLAVTETGDGAWRLEADGPWDLDALWPDDEELDAWVVADHIPDEATAHYLFYAFAEWPDAVRTIARLRKALLAAFDRLSELDRQELRAEYAGGAIGPADELSAMAMAALEQRIYDLGGHHVRTYRDDDGLGL